MEGTKRGPLDHHCLHSLLDRFHLLSTLLYTPTPVLLPREVTQYLSAPEDGEAGDDNIDDLYIDLNDTDRGDHEENVKEDARDANDPLNERQQDGGVVLTDEGPFLSDSDSGVQEGTDPTISKREYKTDGARWRRYQKWLKKSMKASSGPWAKPIR